jgi:transposase
MHPIRLTPLGGEQLQALDQLYRTTHDVRIRTRAQMVLLAAERGLVAADIAAVVRQDEETVRRWLLRYEAEGVAGLSDAPRSGGPSKLTAAYRQQLVDCVRRRPRSLGQPYSLWTLQRLADHLAEQTGLRLSDETVRRALKAEGIVLSRPQHTITSPDPEYALKKRRSRTSATR